jgi:hypothetical protein
MFVVCDPPRQVLVFSSYYMLALWPFCSACSVVVYSALVQASHDFDKLLASRGMCMQRCAELHCMLKPCLYWRQQGGGVKIRMMGLG